MKPQTFTITHPRVYPLVLRRGGRKRCYIMFSFFSNGAKKKARGIAKAALYLASNAGASKAELTVTKINIRDGSSAWIDVFGALYTYAIMTNSFTRASESEYKSILKALPDEFHALGHYSVFAEFKKLSKLLINMKRSSGSVNLELLGLWALEKIGYGGEVTLHPRKEGDGFLIAKVGEELCNYLACAALVSADLEDAGEANWAE